MEKYPEHMRHLSKIIKERRKQLGLSQIELAHDVGFSQSKMSKIETGNDPVDLSFVEFYQLLKVLKLRPNSVWKTIKQQVGGECQTSVRSRFSN